MSKSQKGITGQQEGQGGQPEQEVFYDIERIVGKRMNRSTGTAEYCVRWKGYTEEDDTWEPIENIIDKVLHCDGLGCAG